MSDELIFMELVKDLTFEQFIDLCVTIYQLGRADRFQGFNDNEKLRRKIRSFVKDWLEM